MLQLERSQRLSMMGQLAAGVAHEIKNPLASIKGAVEILCDQATSGKDKQEFSTIVSKEIKRIDRTITDFLAFARPREAAFERLDLSALLEESLRQVETVAAKKNITVQSELAEGVEIYGDGEKIHQVALNLFFNAIEAMESLRKEGRMTIRLYENENGVKFVVSDNGAGIPAAEREKVFEPFYTTKSSGTGLGLAIVKSIVEAHRGTVTLESDSPGGTTVTVTFPSSKEASWR